MDIVRYPLSAFFSTTVLSHHEMQHGLHDREVEKGILLDGRLCPKDDGALRGQHAAISVSERNLAVLDLPSAAFAPDLPYSLDQQEDPVHAGMAVGETATIGVDGQ
jgi:hypothetical protein